METQIYSFSTQIKEKLAKLFELLDRCESERKVLMQENDELKKEINRQKETIERLKTNKFEHSAAYLSEKMKNDEVKKEMIGTIDEVIRAIDRTINSLTKK